MERDWIFLLEEVLNRGSSAEPIKGSGNLVG